MIALARRARFAVVFALIVTADPAGAQTVSCSEAQATVTSHEGYSRDQIALAWNVMVKCGDAAPPAIAAAIRSATLNSARDTLAFLAAWSLADRRLVDSIIVLAKDPSQNVTRRTRFLGLLVRYFDSGLTIDISARGPGGGVALAGMTDDYPFVGNQQIDQAARARAKAAIAWMGVNDANADNRMLATLAAQQLP